MLSLRTRPGWLRRALLVGAAVAVAMSLAPAAPATAQADCGWQSSTGPNGDVVYVWTCTDGGGGPGGSDGAWTCIANIDGQDQQVPCIHPTFGWFTSIYNGCYISPMTPQPPAGADAWQGNEPGDGVVYDAWCFATNGVDGLPFVYHQTSIFFDTLQGILADLIERAIGLLELRGADIHLAPSPEGAGLVGLPVWMWTPETLSTWGPASDSLTALGITLHVTANAERIRWDMGDGNERVCTGPGRPYEPSFGAEQSDCGHVYEAPSRDLPGGRYQITAVTEWAIDWSIEGTTISGTELTTRTSTESVRINELQVVTS